MGECRLLAGISALIAQLALAAVSFSGLYVKRLQERPQRPTRIWAMDVSKQVLGMGAAHASGLLIAILIATKANASECAWYFFAFSFDTTVGVTLTLILHNAILRRLRDALASPQDSIGIALPLILPPPKQHECWKVAIADCGQYGNPPILRRWALQAGEWSLCVVVARALCGGTVALLAPILQFFAEGLDALFSGHPTILLIFVMICCPLLMNAAQLLIQDAILKGWQGAVSDKGAVGTKDEFEGRGSLLLGQSQHPVNVIPESEQLG